MANRSNNNLYDTIVDLTEKGDRNAISFLGESWRNMNIVFLPSLFAYFSDISRSPNTSKVSVKTKTYKNILLQLNLSFKQSNSPYRIESRPFHIQVLHLINSVYTQPQLLNYLSGRYPLKITANINASTIISTIENKSQFVEVLSRLYLAIIASLHRAEANDNIEYYENGSSDVFNQLTISFTSMKKYNGHFLPKKLKLPKTISSAVINPDNQDKYCMIWCILIAKYKLHMETKDYGSYRELNLLKNFPILQEKFDEYKDKFDKLYTDQAPIDDDEIEELESIFDININIYAYIDKHQKDVEVIKRSSFKNTTNEQIARLVFVPYSLCDKSKKNYNVDEFKLNSKSKEDLQELIEKKSFFTEKGHFVLMTETSTLLTRYKHIEGGYGTCKFCDARFTSIKQVKEHSDLCKDIVKTQSNDERRVNYLPNEKDSVKKFNSFYALSKQPFVIYADTETNTDGSHKLFVYRLFVKHAYDESLNRTIERCVNSKEDTHEVMCKKFMDDLFSYRVHCASNMNKYKNIDTTERREYEKKNPKPKCCEWCKRAEKSGTKEEIERTQIFLHHDHNKEKDNIIAWICNSCNQYESRNNKTVSLIFHNLAYDILVLLKSLKHKTFTHRGLTTTLKNGFKLIAKTSMKYTSLTINKVKAEFRNNAGDVIYNQWLPAIKFTDSYAFVNRSLSSIVDLISEVDIKRNLIDKVMHTNTLNSANKTILEIVILAAEDALAKMGEEITQFAPDINYHRIALPTILENVYNTRMILKEHKVDFTQRITKNMTLKQVIPEIYNQRNKTLFSNTYNYIKFAYPEIAEELFPHCTEKGVIAYDHTNLKSMKSPTNLPKECYKNSLDLVDDDITKVHPKYKKYKTYREKVDKELTNDWNKSNTIFDILKKKFKNKMTYKQYFLFYLELDVFLLADFFEFFRTKMMNSHKLDPAHFIGLPGFSQNAMLYYSQNTLHLIPENVSLSKLISKNLRGGFSGIINKISNIANKEGYYISAIDINNLYGWAMSQRIANKFVGEFSLEEFVKEKRELGYSLNSAYAYFLLVDVSAPKEIHDKLKHLPPLISKKTIRESDLSYDQKNTNKVIKSNYKSEKLCATLEGNEQILINYDNLAFYKKLGYRIRKCHKVFKFEKDYIFADYILYNTNFRQKCTNEFEKDLYKLLNNIIYGKSLQRNDLNTDGELISDVKIAHKRLISPLLKNADIIDDDELLFTNSLKKNCKFDTAIQNGFHILELSKLRIYSILYNNIIPFCEENKVDFKILLTDTDSLYIEYNFNGSNFTNYYDYMKALSDKTQVFDMHQFSFGDQSRKKEIGLFLDEEGDKEQIIGLVGLCAKSYCYLKKNLKTKKLKLIIKGKGIRNSYLEALYEFDDYIRCASGKDHIPEKIKFRNISKKDFSNLITETEKVTITDFDDKFFHYKENGELKSLPWGHHKIKDIRKRSENTTKDNDPENL